MVYRPSRALDAQAQELGRPFEDFTLKTKDGLELHAWFFPGDKTTNTVGPVVLYCHGNGGNISHRLAVYEVMLQTGAAVMAFDYRGYGQSGGRPGEEGTYRDTEAAYDWLIQRGYSATNIIVFGESLGGGIASELAFRKPTGGLILQSTFTSVPDIGSEMFFWLPVRWLGSIEYDTHARLPEIQVPVVVMHSPEDELIKYGHAERNFAVANEPKWLIDLEGDHNYSLTDREAFKSGIQTLVDRINGIVSE